MRSGAPDLEREFADPKYLDDHGLRESVRRLNLIVLPSQAVVTSYSSIHDVPKRSLSMAKRRAKKVSCIGMKIWPPSESSE